MPADPVAHRAKWDGRFLRLASHVAGWSKDPSTRVGAVIVRPDLTVASLGFNGFPRGMSDDHKMYTDRPAKYERVVHAEMNAILSAHEPVRGYTLYVDPIPPCERCAVHIIQSGIARVVFYARGERTLRWEEQITKAVSFFVEAGVEVTEV